MSSVERTRKFGATSEADPAKVPLRYSNIPLQKPLEKPSKRKLPKTLQAYNVLSLECKVLKNERNKKFLMVRESGYLPVT